MTAAAARWALDASPQVRWAPGVQEQVRALAVEGLLALPRRGLEAGGLLLGSVTCLSPHEVLIEGLCPIPCEHRGGPGFHLSESDVAALEELLAQTRSMGEFCVVGYYRTRTSRPGAPREAPALDAQDGQLIENYFADPSHIFVAIRPWSMRECEARLFGWVGEELQPVSDVFEMASAGPALMAGKKREAATQAAPEPAPEAQAVAEPSPLPPLMPTAELRPEKPVKPGPSRSRVIQVTVGLAVILAAMLAAGSYEPKQENWPASLARIPAPAGPALVTKSQESARPVTVPVALDELVPEIPLSIWNRLLEPVTVRVTVQVSADGQVAGARPDEYTDGLYRYLALRAAEAAKGLRFVPAKNAAGEAVEGRARVEVTYPVRGNP